MVYLTQLIYVKEGKEDAFNQFEVVAIPTIAKYNGKLLFRIRPETNNFIELNVEKPYEIHLVTFETIEDFENFKGDEERKKFLHLKDESIRESILIQGIKL
ncbi:hypothetical protein AD998_17560 [bacterium 336/3]|nr:hypothetical protein AD998_17560 [bacterium 336/3]